MTVLVALRWVAMLAVLVAVVVLTVAVSESRREADVRRQLQHLTNLVNGQQEILLEIRSSGRCTVAVIRAEPGGSGRTGNQELLDELCPDPAELNGGR